MSRAHVAWSKDLKREPDPAIPSPLALTIRIKRARRDLPPNIRQQATEALAVLDAFLRGIANECSVLGTHSDALHVAARFGVLAASLVREEVPRSTLEMANAISCAYAQSQLERDAAVLAATPVGYRTKGTVPTRTSQAGSVEQSTTADYGERHARWTTSTTQARQERVAFTDLLLRREKGRRDGLVHDGAKKDAMAERVERLIAAEQATAKELAARQAPIIVEANKPEAIPVPVPAPVADTPPHVPVVVPAPVPIPARPSTPEEQLEAELRTIAADYARCRPKVVAAKATLEEMTVASSAPSRAVALVMPRYVTAQNVERNWRAGGCRGPLPVPVLVLPPLVSKWWRDQRPAEAAYSEKVFRWVLQEEQKP